jgi:hypothetical protein
MDQPTTRFRFTMATVMLLVVTSAAASALFAKVHALTPASGAPYLSNVDSGILVIATVVMVGATLGTLKGHSPAQIMLQVTLACLGLYLFLTMVEAKLRHPLLYWLHACFLVLVLIPALVRRAAKDRIERGPARNRRKRTCEAIMFSFVTMMIVMLALFLEWLAAVIGMNIINL